MKIHTSRGLPALIAVLAASTVSANINYSTNFSTGDGWTSGSIIADDSWSFNNNSNNLQVEATTSPASSFMYWSSGSGRVDFDTAFDASVSNMVVSTTFTIDSDFNKPRDDWFQASSNVLNSNATGRGLKSEFGAEISDGQSVTTYQIRISNTDENIGAANLQTLNVATTDIFTEPNVTSDLLKLTTTYSKDLLNGQWDITAILENLDNSTVVGSVTASYASGAETPLDEAMNFHFNNAVGVWANSNAADAAFKGYEVTLAIPEPSSFALLSGFVALGSIMLRRRVA